MPGALWGGGAALAIILILWGMRGKWDLLARHAREGTRHLLAGILMLGTAAGTLWTFSAGGLTLSGAMERVVSVGGIALALEWGAIYTGLYIGELDRRIMTARKREQADYFRAYQANLYKWFYAVVAISAIANLIFRVQQLDNLPLAVFVAGAPIILIILFTIKLRALPVDYQEAGRQAVQRSLVRVVLNASETLNRGMHQASRGHELSAKQLEQLRLAAAMVRIYAPTEQQHALDYAITQHAGAGTVESSAERYLTTSDIAEAYGISTRRAQEWLAACPGRRKQPQGRAWEAPQSAIVAAHGMPTGAALGSSKPLQLGAGESANPRGGARRRGGSATKRTIDVDGREMNAEEMARELYGEEVAARWREVGESNPGYITRKRLEGLREQLLRKRVHEQREPQGEPV